MLTKFVGILIEVIYSGCVETAGPALDAMHRIAFLQKQLSKVAAILSGDAGYEGLFAVAHDCHCCW